MMKTPWNYGLSVVALMFGAGLSAPVWAQAPAASGAETAQQDDEIIVTARRRDETLTAVPVAITVVSSKDLQRSGINDFRALSTALPTLKTSEVTSGAGGSIYIRGVGTTGGLSAGLDQGVSINVDGVQFSRGNILRLGLFDSSGIQVLRGPQALFFGKNSPAGVISITTADPTPTLEISGRGSYETQARELRLQGSISGPLTDTLGARVFVNVDRTDGYYINDATAANAAALNAIRPGTAYASAYDRGPRRRSVFVRGTLKFDPGSAFDARLKLSYNEQHEDNISSLKQKILCPYGTSQVNSTLGLLGNNAALTPFLAIDDCKPNRHFTHGTIPQSTANLAPYGRKVDDDLFQTNVLLASLEMNYNLSPEVKITSVTGYEKTRDDTIDNFSWNPAYLAALTFNTHVDEHSTTQELRLATSFADLPVNFLVGGFFQDAKLYAFNWPAATGSPRFDQYIDTRVYSAFGQAIWNVTDSIELSGGGRYSSERKRFRVNRGGVPQPTLVPQRTFSDFSPEATLTFRPSKQLTVYASYKEGFKSGGFNPRYNSGVIVAPGDDVSYAPERVSGEEIGIKTELFNRSLRLSFAAYNYKYKDLQVTNFDNSQIVAVIRIQNAATARTKGLEFEANYVPASVPGLRLNASINYTDARYINYVSPCFTGQTIAEGCNLRPTASGAFASQDLGGRRLTNSAPWAMSFGASYDFPVSQGVMFGIAGDTKYEDHYNPLPEQDPLTDQKKYWLFNASARVFSEDGRWEFALIGRNLTNVYRAVEIGSASFTGTASRTGTALTGGRPDYTGNLLAPRSVTLQATFKY